MSADREDRSESFLKRWSRVKTEGQQASPAAGIAAPVGTDAKEPPPDLPPLEELTLESDFRGFFHPKVDEDLRRSALRKLFSDPHFNVMDGLDVYIDDYSKSEPIPAAMLASLKQAQRILGWARNEDEDAEKRDAMGQGQENEAPESEHATPEITAAQAEPPSPATQDLEPVPVRKT